MSVMKGIILAGGKATRLYPVTKVVCKQLIPVYDKPMVYYPLSVLMLAGIRDILIITTQTALSQFKDLLGPGRDLGLRFYYAVQNEPRGIAESLIIGEDFIGKDKVALILGDNIFYGHNFRDLLKEAVDSQYGATIFAYWVNNPRRYGVIEFDQKCKVKRIIEKPKKPKSNWVVTGLYFYDQDVVRIAKGLKPSKRNELEITDINNFYLKQKRLEVRLLGRGFAWLDTGTCDSLIEAAMFIKTIEDRQGLKIGCIEEVAFRLGYINRLQLRRLAQNSHSLYGSYLRNIADER